MQQMQQKKIFMKNRINKNVSDKNMCDTFDTPYPPTCGIYCSGCGCCVCKFIFIAYICAPRRCTLYLGMCACMLCVLVCLCVRVCELCFSQPCWFFVLFAFMFFCLLIFIQNAICGSFFIFHSMLPFQFFGSIYVATSVCWLCGCKCVCVCVWVCECLW